MRLIMKYIWLLGLWALLCSFSVCFADDQNFVRVKIAVKTSNEKHDPDLNPYTLGMDVRLLSLGLFQVTYVENNKDQRKIIGKRSLSENPFNLVPSWPIVQPTLLLEWMKEPVSRNLYFQLPVSDQSAFQLITQSQDVSLILGYDTEIHFEEEKYSDHAGRKYILKPDIFNSYIKISGKIKMLRLRDFLKYCDHYLSSI